MSASKPVAVFASVGVVLERISTGGRILVADGVVTQRQSTGGRVFAATWCCYWSADAPVGRVESMPVAL